MVITTLINQLKEWDTAYRAGSPLVSDSEFDAAEQNLRELDPTNPYFLTPNPTPVGGKIFQHVMPMLSTNKAYTQSELFDFIKRGEREAGGSLLVRATTKLDGIASYYCPDKRILATRGDNGFGTDISWMLSKGLKLNGEPSEHCVGEIVISNDYFNARLSHQYAHPRNFVSGVALSDNLSEAAEQAFADGAIELVIYDLMDNAVEVDSSALIWSAQNIEDQLLDSPYPVDGVVFEFVDPDVRKKLGSTSHHHNYQLAKKQVGETAVTHVINVAYQVGKSGVVCPVLEIEPVTISGAVISRVTASNYSNFVNKKLGVGAEIEVVRSGEIIPHVHTCITSSDAEVITSCPCCSEPLYWSKSGVDLVCTNEDCDSRVLARLKHHFTMVGCKGFGDKMLSKLVDAGVRNIETVYSLTKDEYLRAGITTGLADNLMKEIARVTDEPIRDYILLASLGISDLGRGASKRLLSVYRLNELAFIGADKLKQIPQFGEITSVKIAGELTAQSVRLIGLTHAYNLVHTIDENRAALERQQSSSSVLAGKRVVFTGTCSLSRSAMGDDAVSKGAMVDKRVTKDTDYLICGERTGQSKMDSAQKKGVTVISESDYWQLV
ncbi:BRCT domain-containing protein [Vibrio agarivorans]|uniref:BRCT domain-containing protein n=1 Tax=Vibrio agarivorans TaxID=153622 RepID=A0ABT7Y7C2_9VIBR|nr:BRCT domain-containing protein [Vibrio agarivorans]MDN2483888.1 hypothetical protein [Vibrio agarivorans]